MRANVLKGSVLQRRRGRLYYISATATKAAATELVGSTATRLLRQDTRLAAPAIALSANLAPPGHKFGLLVLALTSDFIYSTSRSKEGARQRISMHCKHDPSDAEATCFKSSSQVHTTSQVAVPFPPPSQPGGVRLLHVRAGIADIASWTIEHVCGSAGDRRATSRGLRNYGYISHSTIFTRHAILRLQQ